MLQNDSVFESLKSHRTVTFREWRKSFIEFETLRWVVRFRYWEQVQTKPSRDCYAITSWRVTCRLLKFGATLSLCDVFKITFSLYETTGYSSQYRSSNTKNLSTCKHCGMRRDRFHPFPYSWQYCVSVTRMLILLLTSLRESIAIV
jgi:hypothetical protein